jgi:hypothetical protein
MLNKITLCLSMNLKKAYYEWEMGKEADENFCRSGVRLRPERSRLRTPNWSRIEDHLEAPLADDGFMPLQRGVRYPYLVAMCVSFNTHPMWRYPIDFHLCQ